MRGRHAILACVCWLALGTGNVSAQTVAPLNSATGWEGLQVFGGDVTITGVNCTGAEAVVVVAATRAPTVTAVTHNGDALTSRGSSVTGGVGIAIWTRESPDQTTADVVVTLSAAGTAMAWAVCLDNVDVAGTPYGTVLGTSADGSPNTTPTVSTASNDGLFVGGIAIRLDSGTITDGQTALQVETNLGSDLSGAFSSKAGASGGTTLTWSWPNGDQGNSLVIPVNASGAGGGPPPRLGLMGVGR